MPWKNKFTDIRPITDKIDQEYKGDYSGITYDPIFDCDRLEYIECKGLPPEQILNSYDALFFETWSCKKTNNEGWLYKQLETEYLIQKNKTAIYSVDYPNFRKFWYKIYPNPKLYQDQEYNAKIYIANHYPFSWNKVQSNGNYNKNESEGYWISTEWLYLNNLIREVW